MGINSDIAIHGFGFPADLSYSCEFEYRNGLKTSFPAFSISTETLLCRDVPLAELPIPIVNLKFGASLSLIVPMPAAMSSYRSSQFDLGLPELPYQLPGTAFLFADEALYQPTFQLLCNGNTSVAVPTLKMMNRGRVLCDFEKGTFTGNFLNGDLYCPLPSTFPGNYELRIRSEMGAHIATATIQCVMQSKVLSLYLDAPSFFNISGALLISGVDLDASTELSCVVGSKRVEVTIDSAVSAICDIDLLPGFQKISISVGTFAIFSIDACISPQILLTGGFIVGGSREACNAVLQSQAENPLFTLRPGRSLPAEVIAFWPQAGPSMGFTSVEIILSNLDSVMYDACIFGDTRVSVVISTAAKIICLSPPQPPGNVTLVLTRSAGQIVNVGEFKYFPAIKLISTSPLIISRFTPGMVYLTIAGLALNSNDYALYCRAEGTTSSAFVVSMHVLSCSLPITVNPQLTISIGSLWESFSNALSIDVVDSLILKPVPSRGSINGGTPISIFFPSFAVVKEPVCYFGDRSSTAIYALNDTIICITPAAASIGVVQLTVSDARVGGYNNPFSLGHGVYSYEVSADIAEVRPSSIFRNSAIDLIIHVIHISLPCPNLMLPFLQGFNFVDSTALACLLPGNIPTRGRYLSGTRILCVLSSNLTSALSSGPLRVSNNGLDWSASSALLSVTTATQVTSFSPTSGFVSGGTPVSFTLLQPIDQATCHFSYSLPSLAYTVDNTTYICIAPPLAEGAVNISLIADSVEVFSFPFQVYEIPAISTAMPSFLIENIFTQVLFEGTNINSGLSGRIRSSSGDILDSICAPLSNALLSCNVSAPARGIEGGLYLDLTINRINFIENIFYLPTFPRAEVVLLTPWMYSTSSELIFSVKDFNIGQSLSCAFFSDSDSTLPMTRKGIFQGSCKVRTSSASSPLFVSVLQGNVSILGPLTIEIVEVPTAVIVEPESLTAGVASSVLFHLSPGDAHANMAVKCILHSSMDVVYPTHFINSSYIFCVIQTYEIGVFKLSLVFGELMIYNYVTQLRVQATVTNFVVNATAVMNKALATLSILSSGCSFSGQILCKLDEVFGTILVAEDNCSATCGAFVFSSSSYVTLQLCSTVHCSVPLVSKTLQVLSAPAIAAVYPVTGNVLGGTLVTISGAGFTSDASLMCAFGSSFSKAFVSSDSTLSCASPAVARPAESIISLWSHGLQVAIYDNAFEHIAAMPIRGFESLSLFASGGNTVIVNLASIPKDADLSCVFDEFYIIPALPLNSSHLQCVAPSLRLGNISFYISQHGDIFTETRFLQIVPTPSLLYFEPYTVLSDALPVFSFSLSDSLSPDMSLECAIDGVAQEVQADGLTVTCATSKPLRSGPHDIALLSSGVRIWGSQIFSHSTVIVRIRPTTGYSIVPSVVSVTSVTPFDTRDVGYCSFNGTHTSPRHLSTFEIECLTPVIILQNDGITSLPLSLISKDGHEQSTGLNFDLIPMPIISSISPLNGSYLGRTLLSINLMRHYEHPIYFRAGLRSFICDHPTTTLVLCTTRENIPGRFDIELSPNNLNFVPSGYRFSYLPSLPGPGASTVATGLSTSSPSILYIDPQVFPAGSLNIVHVKGSGFTPTSDCTVDGIKAFSTTYISASSLSCTLGPYPPGNTSFGIIDAMGGFSKLTSIAFSNQVAVTALSAQSNAVSPSSGPNTGGTIINLSGSNFDLVSGNLYCLVNGEYILAFAVTSTSLKCVMPPSLFSGYANVYLADQDKIAFPEYGVFEYIVDPVLYTSVPLLGPVGTELLLRGMGFVRISQLQCFVGGVEAQTVVLSDSALICTVPPLKGGSVLVSLRTNSQNFAPSTTLFTVRPTTKYFSLWPENGPSQRGGTIVTIKTSQLPNTVDLACQFGSTAVTAVRLSEESILCRAPPLESGFVNVSVLSEGVAIGTDPPLQFLYTPDCTVNKITPTHGSSMGGYNVMILANNIINTTAIQCVFGPNLFARGIFISPTMMSCVVPPVSASVSLNNSSVALEISLNGQDYTDNRVPFMYESESLPGLYRPNVVPLICPNGTHCTSDRRNFTLCEPGHFQRIQQQDACDPCPVGFVCPDFGMSSPQICPAGFVCDRLGLRYPATFCPMGHYCPPGNLSHYLEY